MNQITIIVTIITCIIANAANAKPVLFGSLPRFGVEFGERKLKWQDNMGKGHFAESFPQVDLFVELPIFEQFSLKLGHEETIKRNRLVAYADDSRVLSAKPLNMPKNFLTSAKLSANYLDAIYNYSILQQDKYTIQFLAFLGISKGKIQLIQCDVKYGDATDGFTTNYLTTSKMTYLRKGLGIQFLSNNGVGLKIGITHEQTSKLKSILVTDAYTYTTAAKNSTIFNLGISYQL